MKRFELGYVAPYNVYVSENVRNKLERLNKEMNAIFPVLSKEYLVPRGIKKRCLDKKKELDEEFKVLCKNEGWI